MLSLDSPLYQLPPGAPRAQLLFADGVYFSLEMLELGYSRLVQALLAEESGRSGDEEHDSHVRIFFEAWSVVDVLHRLRVLVSRFPGLRTSSPAVRSFMRKTDGVRSLRNAVQHLDNEIGRIHCGGAPAWGSISWCRPPQPPAKSGDRWVVGVIVPGSLGKFSAPAVNPVGRACDWPVGLIELTASGRTTSLTDCFKASVLLAHRLERAASVAACTGARDTKGNFLLEPAI